MKSPGKIAPAVLVVLVALLTGGWFLQQGVAREQNVYFQARLFQEVVDHVAERYVDEVDRDSLYRSAIDGLLDELGDPNTSFLNASDYENLRIRTEGEYGGVGLEIVEREGWITVVSPLPGTPATRAGIRAGDQIVEVEGESMRDWSTEQAVQRLRGEPGTDVRVRIRRPGVESPIPFTLTRAHIEVRSVPFATILEDDVGYVPLQLVSESSAREVRTVVDSLRNEGMRGLVLDLRGNPGGLLDVGVELTDLFIERDDVVVETRGRASGQDEVLTASGPQAFPDLPVVVLVDERSASASEILAGALQDHDRALVVGNTSFGKGSVQTLFRLTGGNVLKLTTARWYTPSGRSIQKPHEEQMSLSDRGVLALDGSYVLRADTAARPEFETMGGRTVLGGGGITPDLLVLPDTLTRTEQVAVNAIYKEAGTFNLALFNFAARYLQDHPEAGTGSRIDDRVLREFYAYLEEQGMKLERQILREADRFIRFQVGRELALQAGGDRGEFRFLAPADRQLQEAVELLKNADSPGSLFQVADAR